MEVSVCSKGPCFSFQKGNAQIVPRGGTSPVPPRGTIAGRSLGSRGITTNKNLFFFISFLLRSLFCP